MPSATTLPPVPPAVMVPLTGRPATVVAVDATTRALGSDAVRLTMKLSVSPASEIGLLDASR